MITRSLVNSADRSRGEMYDCTFDMPRGLLNEHAGKLVRFSVEWATPVEWSSIDSSYEQNTGRPLSLLTCSSFPVVKTHKAWNQGNKDLVLALLPSARQTAYYGVVAVTPYLQSTSCGVITRGDNLATLGELQFKLFDTMNTTSNEVSAFAPSINEDFSFTLVFWTDEPESLYLEVLSLVAG